MYTILILDDEQTHLFAIQEYLSSKGFNVFVSNCPVAALSFINKLQPDLLILDILMPSINGYMFINKLKSYNYLPKIPFIFLTAKGMTQDRIQAYSMGCSAYISKPFDPDELVAMIINILNREKQCEQQLRKVIKQIKILKTYLESEYYVFDSHIGNLVLTPQENNVLNYLTKGLKNKEIAYKLHTSVRNVEKYVTRLLNKTNTTNRADLIRFIYLQHFNQLPENPKANDGDRTRE